MAMDPVVRQQLRATDTREKQAGRARRYRGRRKAEIGVPRDGKNGYPVTEIRGSGLAGRLVGSSVTGSVLCGHCKRMFLDASVGVLHVAECPVRDQQTAKIKRTGECCVCQGKAWHETPCLCFCHYPEAPAWTMTKGGYGLPLHRHRDDATGRCVVCGSQSDRRVSA